MDQVADEFSQVVISLDNDIDEIKRISTWAAIVFAPTLVGTAYGTIFELIPGFKWRYGYPAAILIMIVVSASLYLLFRKQGWIT